MTGVQTCALPIYKSLPLGDVLGSVMAQFYDDKPAPRLILTSHDFEDRALLADGLSERMGHKVEILCPQRGEKRALVDHAQTNARDALARRLAETAGQEKLLTALGAAFGLATIPRRIEVYDNSHIMGTNAIGAMIVAGPAGFMKTHYRTFNFRFPGTNPGDDYGMMREVLERRFAKVNAVPTVTQDDPQPQRQESHADAVDSFPTAPDLVIVDGGKGQFEVARSVLGGLGLRHIPIVSIAKGENRNAGNETFFTTGREPFRLPPRDPALYFIQRLRDEAHRFAIGTHRAKRKRDTLKNPLDEIAGIGPTRKRALLLHFGTDRKSVV